MNDIACYLETLTRKLRQAFGQRLAYVGLQGSHLRGEAGPDSDLDVVVVVAHLTLGDLDQYRKIIQSLPNADRACGFLCGQEELACWNPLEICNLLHGTRDHYGCLQELVPAYRREDARNYCQFSLNALYHTLCHTYVHAGQADLETVLPQCYKTAFFILQNLHYLQRGYFAESKAALRPRLTGRDRAVLERLLDRQTPWRLAQDLPLLFSWCQERVCGQSAAPAVE